MDCTKQTKQPCIALPKEIKRQSSRLLELRIRKKNQIFLRNHTYVGDAGVSCQGQLLIYHSFPNCEEMTTAPYLDSTQHHTIGSNKESETTPDEVQTFTTTNYQRSTVDSTIGIKDTEVIIYLSGGAGICIILICSIVCFCVGKKYQRTNINQKIGNNQQINLNNRANVDDAVLISQNVSIKRRSDIEYAEINELEMSDFISSPSEQGNTTAGDNSNNSSEGIRLPSDGNLNPYQSLLPTLQQPTHIQKDDSDDFEESRAYTNVYQSLQRKRQEKSRLYARCASLLCVEVVDEPI